MWKPESCPVCGDRHVLVVVRGLPNSSVRRHIEAGEAVSGGIFPDAPGYACGACQHRWNDPRDPREQERERAHEDG